MTGGIRRFRPDALRLQAAGQGHRQAGGRAAAAAALGGLKTEKEQVSYVIGAGR